MHATKPGASSYKRSSLAAGSSATTNACSYTVVVVALLVPLLTDPSGYGHVGRPRRAGWVLQISFYRIHGGWADVYRESCLNMVSQDGM